MSPTQDLSASWEIGSSLENHPFAVGQQSNYSGQPQNTQHSYIRTGSAQGYYEAPVIGQHGAIQAVQRPLNMSQQQYYVPDRSDPRISTMVGNLGSRYQAGAQQPVQQDPYVMPPNNALSRAPSQDSYYPLQPSQMPDIKPQYMPQTNVPLSPVRAVTPVHDMSGLYQRAPVVQGGHDAQGLYQQAPVIQAEHNPQGQYQRVVNVHAPGGHDAQAHQYQPEPVNQAADVYYRSYKAPVAIDTAVTIGHLAPYGSAFDRFYDFLDIKQETNDPTMMMPSERIDIM